MQPSHHLPGTRDTIAKSEGTLRVLLLSMDGVPPSRRGRAATGVRVSKESTARNERMATLGSLLVPATADEKVLGPGCRFKDSAVEHVQFKDSVCWSHPEQY